MTTDTLALPAAAPGRRLSAAIALSLLAHAALLLSRLTSESSPPPENPALRVQLRAAAPAPPAVAPPAKPRPSTARPAAKPAVAARAPQAQPQAKAPGAVVAAPPVSGPAAGPALTLDGLRRQVREQAAAAPEQNAAPLPADPAKTKMARSIERAQKPDCRKAHAGGGADLLTLGMLVIDSVREDGCNW